MTLQDIENALYDRLGFDAAPATVVTTRLRRMVNETQREIMSQRGCSKLRRAILPFVTVAGDASAVLPQAAVNIIAIVDRTNNWVLQPVELQDLRADDPGFLVSGNPDRYFVVNYAAPTARNPSDASVLYAKSDSVSDNSSKTVKVEGVNSGGNYFSLSAAMNGTTAVDVSGIGLTWLRLSKFYLAPSSGSTLVTAAGTVTLHEDSGSGTEIARIAIGKRSARYTRLNLAPVPASVMTYYADVELHIDDMSSLADEPYLPEDFHWLLVAGALEKEWRRKGKTIDATEEARRLKRGIQDLKLFLRRYGGANGGKRGKFVSFESPDGQIW